MSRRSLAVYWAASCGGCDVALLELHEALVDLDRRFEILFWPAVMDFKYAALERMEPGSIDVGLFNGAVRTSENERLARTLRERCRTLVAFGSCAHEGCIPALACDTTRDEILGAVYGETPPQTDARVPEGAAPLPEFFDDVRALDQVVEVDYYVPGCPPEPSRVAEAIAPLAGDGSLPERGGVLGAASGTCCDECPRTREEKRIRRFVRVHEIQPDPDRCLLDQGLICIGPATRAGCGAACVRAGMPCRGCYGPPRPCGTRERR